MLERDKKNVPDSFRKTGVRCDPNNCVRKDQMTARADCMIDVRARARHVLDICRRYPTVHLHPVFVM